MLNTVKFMDESLTMLSELTPFLRNQTFFTVVSVVGQQGAGKSTIASLLADPPGKYGAFKRKKFTFAEASAERTISAGHETQGVSCFITEQRIILLDFQALLSSSIMDHAISKDRHGTLEYNSTENQLEIESIQLLSLAMNVSHVVLVVQDGMDTGLLRLLHTAGRIKSTPGLEYTPALVVVHNRAISSDFRITNIRRHQEFYRAIFPPGDFEFETGIGLSTGTVSAHISKQSTGKLVNLFFIPDWGTDKECCATFNEVMWEFRRQILGIAPKLITHVDMTERTWFQYANRTWDNIRKNPLYGEYCSHLP